MLKSIHMLAVFSFFVIFLIEMLQIPNIERIFAPLLAKSIGEMAE